MEAFNELHTLACIGIALWLVGVYIIAKRY